LYKNGVGFFEHAGRVTGDEAVTIDLTSAQLNDVLQSLTAIDLNGRTDYRGEFNSTTPLDHSCGRCRFDWARHLHSRSVNSLRGAR